MCSAKESFCLLETDLKFKVTNIFGKKGYLFLLLGYEFATYIHRMTASIRKVVIALSAGANTTSMMESLTSQDL